MKIIGIIVYDTNYGYDIGEILLNMGYHFIYIDPEQHFDTDKIKISHIILSDFEGNIDKKNFVGIPEWVIKCDIPVLAISNSFCLVAYKFGSVLKKCKHKKFHQVKELFGTRQTTKKVRVKPIDSIQQLSDNFTVSSISSDKQIMGFTDNSKWWALSYETSYQQYHDIIQLFLNNKKVNYACGSSNFSKDNYSKHFGRGTSSQTDDHLDLTYQIDINNVCKMRYYTVKDI